MNLHRTPPPTTSRQLRNRDANVAIRNQNKEKGNIKSRINNTFSVDQVKSNTKKESSSSQPLPTLLNETIVIDNENSASIVLEHEVNDLSIEQKFDLLLKRTSIILSSYDALHKTIVDYQKTISDLVADNKKLTEENISIRNKLNNLEEVINSKKEIPESREVFGKYNDLQQKIKTDECEFWGIDEYENEDLVPLIIAVAKEFQVDVLEEDIIYAARKKKFRSNGRNFVPRPILVKFYNRAKRDNLIKAGRTIRIKKHDEIDPRNGSNFIYVNEALTNHNEFIYGKARELMKKKKIEKTWCKLGKIYVKSTPRCAPKLIKDLSDLNEFK